MAAIGDLQFNCGIRFFHHQYSFALRDKIAHALARQGIDRPDFQHGNLDAEIVQQLARRRVRHAGRDDAERELRLGVWDAQRAGGIQLGRFKLGFDLSELLVQFTVEQEAIARGGGPTLRVLFEIRGSRRRVDLVQRNVLPRVRDAHRRAQNDRHAVFLRERERGVDHFFRFARRRWIEHRHFGENREKARVLFGLRGKRPRIITHDHDESAHDACVRRAQQRIARDVQADLLHGDRRALAGPTRRERNFERDLFVDRPLDVGVQLKFLFPLDDGWQNL